MIVLSEGSGNRLEGVSSNALLTLRRCTASVSPSGFLAVLLIEIFDLLFQSIEAEATGE